MSRHKVHAIVQGDTYTFCGRFYKDVREAVRFRATEFIDGQTDAARVTCKACWRMAA